jgi:hypothetical protein
MMMKNFFTTTMLAGMLLISYAAQAQDSLFISELIDPADDYTGRFIELYNAGSEPVDFSTTTCFLSRQSNGGTTWGDLQLTGSVAPGATFVIGGSGFEALYGRVPDQESGILIGNGDDAYALFNGGDHETGVLHDIMGVMDVDGTGEPWEYTDSRALRMDHVLTPNPVWTASEWEISSANVADGDPGTHLDSVPADTILPGSYSLSLVNDTVIPGQVAEVVVLVSELHAEDDIISFQFDVDFDTAALIYEGYTLAGTLSEGGTAVVNPAAGGRLRVGYMNTSPLVGAGNLLRLQFTSLMPDTTELIISNAFLNSIPVTALGNASVFIGETAPPTAVITYDDTENRFADTLLITATFSEAMSATNPVRLNLSGAVDLAAADMIRVSEYTYTYLYEIPRASGEVDVLLSNGTDLWGNPLVPEPTAGGMFTIIGLHPGDVNDDGVILAYDAALALRYSVGIDPLPEADPMPWEPWRDSTANVDGTGGITANDAGLILQYSAGIISGFPSEVEAPAAMAQVSVALEGNHVVFYSHGELLGLNVNAGNENGALGNPEILLDSYLWAANLEGGKYRIGLCTASAASEGEAVLKIPFAGSGPVTFHLIENTREREITVNLAASGPGRPDSEILLYPNPVEDLLLISGLNGRSAIRITDILGQELQELSVTGEAVEMDLSDLHPGLYLLTIDTGTKKETRRIVKSF